MDTLQKSMDAWLSEELPRTLVVDLLDKKLRAERIRLSKRKLKQLADKILEEKLDSFELDEDLNGRTKKKLTIEFTDADAEQFGHDFEKVLDRLPAIIRDLVEKTSQSLLVALEQKWAKESRAQRRDIDGFRKHLQERWGVGLDKLRLLITIAREYGSEINKSLGAVGGGDTPKTFEILMKLHARSCQIAEEVVCLLSAGFADGAMARWRTLHEIAAVSDLMRRYGEELAERYEQHQVVKSYKAAKLYQNHQQHLGQEPISDVTMKRLEANYNALKARYGREFTTDQGWAAKHLGKS